MDSNSEGREYENLELAPQYSGSHPGRMKQAVFCKRKTNHLTVARKKLLISGKSYDRANKKNKINCMQDMQKDIFDMDPREFPLNENNNHETGRTSSKQTDCCTLTELTKDHKNTGVFVDFLPVISKSIDESSPRITTDCCVDLLSLVKEIVFFYAYMLVVGLKWINSVLKNCGEELRASGYDGSAKPVLDK
uniref:Katanin p80 subunit C-terminal domain-containing protein n=1 Tax=Monopterus albus TaxID=43700 RepID=A0A3Q3JRY2_MONAL